MLNAWDYIQTALISNTLDASIEIVRVRVQRIGAPQTTFTSWVMHKDYSCILRIYLESRCSDDQSRIAFEHTFWMPVQYG